jgi:hypothetical protein
MGGVSQAGKVVPIPSPNVPDEGNTATGVGRPAAPSWRAMWELCGETDLQGHSVRLPLNGKKPRLAGLFT